LQLAFGGVAGTGVVEKLGDGAGRDRVGVPCFPITLRGAIAEDLSPVRIDDDDPVAEIEQRRREAIPFGDGRVGSGSNPFALRIEERCGTLLASKRAQPNLPVM
jgi:hypothetical protein